MAKKKGRGKRAGLAARSKNARKAKAKKRYVRKLEKVVPLPGTAVELQTAKAEAETPKAEPLPPVDAATAAPPAGSPVLGQEFVDRVTSDEEDSPPTIP